MQTVESIKKEFQKCDKLKMFEIEVIEKETNSTDFILFEISIEQNNFIAHHIPLTKEQQNSNKIAFVSIEIDDVFSLDEHLQSLYESCFEAIIGSDFYDILTR